MLGVALNIATVLAGTLLGLLFGRLIPQRFRDSVFFAIGTATLAFGVVMVMGGYTGLSATQVGSLTAIVLVVSLVAGALTGELLRIEDGLENLGGLLQGLLPGTKTSGGLPGAKTQDSLPAREGLPASTFVESKEGMPAREGLPASTFVEGFVTASVFFCAGSMTVIGSLQAGLGDPSLLYLKATLDGVSALALSTALGKGVGFSVITIAVVQGGIALAASGLASVVTTAVTASLELVGGAMLVALGIEILGIKRLKVANFLPALVYAVILAGILG